MLSKGTLVLIGSRAWLSRHGVSIPPELEGHAASLEWQGKTVVFVAGAGEAKGVLAVADSVRPEAREAVATLHRLVLGCRRWLPSLPFFPFSGPSDLQTGRSGLPVVLIADTRLSIILRLYEVYVVI